MTNVIYLFFHLRYFCYMLYNDIQQIKNFRNEYHKTIVNIQFTSNWILERVKIFVEQKDITPQQYNILRILRGSIHPLSTQQIRDRMLDKMSDASRLVDRLVKKELVLKKVSNIDKRLVDITISEKGLELLKELDEKNKELDNIIHNLSEEEATTINNLLDKIRHN